MLDKIIQRIPMSTKVRLGLNAVGVSTEEQKTLDSFISVVGSNPLISIGLGQEVNSLAALTDMVGNWSQRSDAHSFGVPTARRVLSDPRGKEMVAKVILDAVAKSPQKGELEQIIGKIANAPLPGFGDTEYPDIRTFLVDGALPLVESMLPRNSNEAVGLGALVRCPYCKQTHIFPIEG